MSHLSSPSDSSPTPAPSEASTPPQQTVERERADAFSQALRTLLQWHEYYVPLTGSYLLPQFYERLRAQDGVGIQIPMLRAYLRGEALPSEAKVRLIADALDLRRAVLLFAAGYLKAEDLPDYPGPRTTLAALESDLRDLEQLELSLEAQTRITYALRNSARILHILHGERPADQWVVEYNERELVLDQLNELWDAPPPEPLQLTSVEETAEEEAMLARAEAAAPRLATVNPVNTSPAASSNSVMEQRPAAPTPAAHAMNAMNVMVTPTTR